MRLEFKGIVATGNSSRVDEDGGLNGAIFIGGVDLVDEIAEQAWAPNVTVTLNGEPIANGAVVTEIGWGYSEYTPIDDDRAVVGECDLLQRLESLDGKEVHLIIHDDAEPHGE